MNTECIVVLTAADKAGGIAEYLANRSGKKPLLIEPVAQLPSMDALAAADRPIGANGAGLMAALWPTGMRVPGLTPTLK